MSDAYTWVYLDDAGREVTSGEGIVTSAFPTQGDAEAWFGESWETLAEAGVAAVTLRRDGVDVYGPMSLAPES
ncbi:MAG: hypothetical protein ABR500_02590 [Dermatophilaceae bacterium]|nr:hypothetical protein [Intrasporangiaceae bacterium]